MTTNTRRTTTLTDGSDKRQQQCSHQSKRALSCPSPPVVRCRVSTVCANVSTCGVLSCRISSRTPLVIQLHTAPPRACNFVWCLPPHVVKSSPSQEINMLLIRGAYGNQNSRWTPKKTIKPPYVNTACLVLISVPPRHSRRSRLASSTDRLPHYKTPR